MPSIPPPLPWKALAEPRPDREYLVVLTFLPPRRLSKLPRFFGDVRNIRKQLNARPDGLIGNSMLAKALRSRYWTLSVWEDIGALGQLAVDSHGMV